MMPCKKITLPLNYTEAWSRDDDMEHKEEPAKALTSNAVAPKKQRRTKKFLMEERSFEVMRKFSMNYLCVKKVLEHCDWRDLNLLSKVCELWKEAAASVARGKLSPCSFLLLQSREKIKTGSVTYMASGHLKLEPMFIISFLNQKATQKQYKCKDFQSPPCDNKCRSTHKFLDFIYSKLCYPSNCLIGIKCPAVIFNSGMDTDPYFGVRRYVTDVEDLGFLAGFALPKIPGVIFHKENFCLSHDDDTIYHYYHYINNILDNEVVKCVMLFPSQVCYRSDHEQLSLAINYLFGRQQSQSFAIGGSVVKAVATDNFHRSQMTNCKRSDMLVMVLSVSKRAHAEENLPKFEVCSLVLWQHPSNVQDFRRMIKEFATKVPKYRYSTALQFADLSLFMGCCDCAGPKPFDIFTSEFCSMFPQVNLTGCYGDAQLGASHPPPEQKQPVKFTTYEDRYIFDNDSCVFLYFTWGT